MLEHQDDHEAVYTISVASRLTRLPIHTIRWLEAHKFICPARTSGRQRLFTQQDIELLLEIGMLLSRKVNIAGIRVILDMKRVHNIEQITLSIETEEPEID